MQYGSIMGHASANLAFVAVLTSSFALLAFSKYWRAQITPITDHTALFALTYEFLQAFTLPDFSKCHKTQIAPLPTMLYYSLLLWIFTGLYLAGFLQVPSGSDYHHYRPYCIIRFSYEFI